MPASLSFSTAVLIGLLGATHCIAMCGGIASSLSLGGRSDGATGRLLAYNAGRLLSYAVAGALFGLIGAGIQQTAAAPLLRFAAALLLISMGLYVAQWWQGVTYLERIGGQLWKRIAPWLKPLLPADTAGKALLLGIGWGWLPCGLVYSTLIWSSAASSSLHSALLMIGFGIGTLPAMLATGLLAQQLRDLVSRKPVKAAAGVMLILMGIWTLPWTMLLHLT